MIWETYEVDGHDFKVDIPVGWVGDEPYASPFTLDGEGKVKCRQAEGNFAFQSLDRKARVSFNWRFWGEVNRHAICFWRHSVTAEEVAKREGGDEVISSDYVTKHGELRRWQYLHHYRVESTRWCDEERARLASVTNHYILEVKWSACESSIERYRDAFDHFLNSFSSRDGKIR